MYYVCLQPYKIEWVRGEKKAVAILVSLEAAASSTTAASQLQPELSKTEAEGFPDYDTAEQSNTVVTKTTMRV